MAGRSAYITLNSLLSFAILFLMSIFYRNRRMRLNFSRFPA
jgi:hypothetical protein